MGDVEVIKLKKGEVVNNRWKIARKLGEGAFGAVYETIDTTKSIKHKMALKTESRLTGDQILKIEVSVLESMPCARHVCRLYSCGRTAQFNFLIMSLLGPTVDALRHKNHKKRFTPSTACRLIFQCVKGIRSMHEAGWLHRDIKPSNFAVGGDENTSRTIFVFDFGLARKFVRSNGRLRPARPAAGFRGTIRYCSVNGHKKMEQGRHDDLISILYMYVEFTDGKLPWGDLYDEQDTYKCKLLTHHKLYDNLPSTVPVMHAYLHQLRYEDAPNYELLEKALLDEIEKKEYHMEPFDWEIRKKWYNLFISTNPQPRNHRRTTTATSIPSTTTSINQRT